MQMLIPTFLMHSGYVYSYFVIIGERGLLVEREGGGGEGGGGEGGGRAQQ